MVMMRLVRDDDVIAEVQLPTEENELTARGRKPRRADHPSPQPVDQEEGAPTDESPDPPDGVITDTAEDAANEAGTDVAAELDLATLEALLFATHHPLTAGRLAEMLDVSSTKPLRRAIKELNRQYEQSGRAFRVEQVAGGYQLLTLPEYGDYLNKLLKKEADAKLTKAALETLAIIAYKQPILRADLEAIRGVACGETIRSLMEKHLVKIDGRAELPGRPILYGTTRRFLELFGLNSLKDLPQSDIEGKK
jgi:segregation and condensation protein B